MTRIRVGALEHRLAAMLCAVEKGAPAVVSDRDRPTACLSPIPEDEGLTVLPATRPFAAIRDRKISEVRGPVDSLALLRAERGTR